MASAPPAAQLTDILGSLKRHWSTVVVVALIGLVIGVLAFVAISSRYRATSTVSVNPMNAGSLTSTDTSKSVSIPTEEGLVTSRRVATATATLLGSRDQLSPSDIQHAIDVTSPQDSLLLNISFTGDSPRQAAAGADAVAKAYLQSRRSDASDQVDRQIKTATSQIQDIQDKSGQAAYSSTIAQRSLRIQADALGNQLAQLGNFDLNPGQVVGSAETPTGRSTPGLVPLGIGGLFLGILVGIPAALTRKEDDSEIGGVEGLSALNDQIILDGTHDTNRADTWDIAAFMLKIPEDVGLEGPFTIMVDADSGPSRSTTPGQELVDALARRGRTARFVDAGLINEGKISRGWPTDRKRISWAGEIIVIDTTHLTSDANKVALATRSDLVLLARSTSDDAAALRRFAGLLKTKRIDIALTTLFPPRPEMMSLSR